MCGIFRLGEGRGPVSGNGIRFVWHFQISEQLDVAEGALVHAVEAGLIALDEGKAGAGLGVAEGGGNAPDLIAEGLSGDSVIEGAGFDGPGAAHAPEGEGHFLDDAELDAIGGLKAGDVLGDNGTEGLRGFIFENGAAGEHAVAERVHGSAAFAFRSDWPPGTGAVGARGADFSFRRHHFPRSQDTAGEIATEPKCVIPLATMHVNGFSVEERKGRFGGRAVLL